MFVRFPNLDVLKLAITANVAPESIVSAPVKAAFGEAGEIWLQPSANLPRSARTALGRLGAQFPWRAAVPLDESFACWIQLFPLVREPGAPALADRTPVLFDLHDPEQLPEVVAEVLRLGNDRQSFCHVACGEQVRALLRVVGPPYYSLLRALDRDAGSQRHVENLPDGTARQVENLSYAYIERRPRVWIEIGQVHPLVERIVPPAGQCLLIRGPRQWDFIEETPFQDIYQSLDCRLPHSESAWQPAQLARRITVPLRLASGGSDAAELWVLGEEGEAQVDALVSASDDELLGHLAFAVGERDGQRRIVVRVRPSKQAPPVLVLDALAFRPYLKLPNLFVPCGRRVHPPLRRSAVAELLAPDSGRITWLYPCEDGRFTPESLPDAAFRPLRDWIDYVLDREHEALQSWIDAHRFDFESFVCCEDRRPKEDRPDRPAPAAGPRSPAQPSEPASQDVSTAPQPKADELQDEVAESRPDPRGPSGPTERDAIQKRLFDLEQQFRASPSPLDGNDRAALWQQMAEANARLGHHLDAAICWADAVWEHDARIDQSRAVWQQSAIQSLGAAWKTRSETTIRADDLDRLLSDRDTLPDQAAGLANYLICASRPEPPARELVERLGVLARHLERHEGVLPMRTAWLAWLAVYRLSGGDVLALARARDRALERLYAHGLRPDVDLPSFLRGPGMADSQQLRVLRERLGRLQRMVTGWIHEPAVAPKSARTREYAGLMFAYAMARLGETTGCQKLLEEIRPSLGGDPIHRWVWDAFQFRIRQAIDGKPGRGVLEPELMGRLEPMDRLAHYKIDRLRQNSRILEPSEKIDPYRNWRQYLDDFTREVKVLADIQDHQQLAAQLETLFGKVGQGPQGRAREAMLLASALELGPRLGESVSTGLLARVAPLLQRGVEPEAAEQVLEKAVFLAAHFDQHESVEALLGRICTLLEGQQTEAATESLQRMLSECFRGLRKLGMRDEIGRLLARLSAMARQERPSPDRGKRAAVDDRQEGQVRLLLLVASGWLFFGQQPEAIAILDEARDRLLHAELKPEQRSALAQTYVSSLGYAPAEFALPRIEELFASARGADGKTSVRLPRISDSMTTTTHFSIFQLRVVEAIVLALAGDELVMNSEGRRWLDEDEFLVRRRMHRDVRTATNSP